MKFFFCITAMICFFCISDTTIAQLGEVINEKAVYGAAASDNFGNSVSGAGDVNGDGYDDFIAGAIFNDGGGSTSGRAYIYFGGAAFNAAPDVILTGDSVFSYFGCSVSSAGDVNGDGYDDVIVGAYRASSFNGKAYIFFGGALMNNVPDVTFFSQSASENFGFSVSEAGDVNGDGFSDVIVGAYAYSSNTGRAYIFFGGSSMNTVVDVTLTGGAASNNFGYSVSNAGDVNGDGFGDVICGAYGYSSSAGRAYVFYGGASMNNSADVIMTGSASSMLGFAVSSAGDINGDGYYDVIAGAEGYGSNRGRAYIFRGGASMDNTADITFTGENLNDHFGSSVSSAGDINGDGFSDILIGAVDFNASEGKAYVYTGGIAMDNVLDRYLSGAGLNSDFASSVSSAGDINNDGYSDFIIGEDTNDEAATNAGKAYVYINSMTGIEATDMVFDGNAATDNFGNSVSPAGDLNNDGYDDFIVGAKLNDSTGSAAGQAYIFFGGANLDKIPDLILNGAAAGDQFGTSVSKAGDVNGDGYDDVIVGAPNNDAGASNSGRAYIYFGGASMNNSADVLLTGANIDDRYGYSVSDAGDVNGDGFADVVIGSNNTQNSYLYYGGSAMNNVVDVNLTGYNISSAGDVNGDGFDDVITGNPNTTNGTARIYYGSVLMNSGVDVTMNGQASGDNFGISVSKAGDVNGDGYGDVIVGAYFNDNGGNLSGSSYIFYGGFIMNNSADVMLSGLEASDYFGQWVSSAGDLNDDGFDDVIICALDESPVFYSGYICVYYGGANFNTVPDLIMKGNGTEEFYGWPCAGAGDVNGDGKQDLLVGSYGFSGIQNDAGRVFLYRSLSPEINPALVSVKDVPFDQGGKVKLKWLKSGYDTRGINLVTHYIIYRSDPPGAGGYNWEEIGSVSAAMTTSYNFTANTNYDSSQNTNGVFYFKVAARTDNVQEIWESNIVSGQSVDNLSPFPPQNLSAIPDENSVNLFWNENSEDDFHYYIVYRNGIEIYTTVQNNFDDSSVMNDSVYQYRVAAVDVHGNISSLSEQVSVTFNNSTILNLTLIMEGFYIASQNSMSISDTAIVYLRGSSFPYAIIDSSNSTINKNTLTGEFHFSNVTSGSFYISVRHRNTIQTWSSSAVSFIPGGAVNFNFTDADSKAFGNNMIQVDLLPTAFAIFSGDVNQDGVVDISDNQLIDNDVYNFVSGYVGTDLTGDYSVDLSDAAIADNNAANYVSVITP